MSDSLESKAKRVTELLESAREDLKKILAMGLKPEDLYDGSSPMGAFLIKMMYDDIEEINRKIN